MARIVNAVIGKKNKTWCDHLMLDATLSRILSPSLMLRRAHVAPTGLSAYIRLTALLACKTRRSRLPTVSHAGVVGLRRGFGS